MSKIRDRCYLLLQHLLPQHYLSRLIALVADVEVRWFKTFVIRLFIRHYKVNINEAQHQDVAQYKSFNDFFTRALMPQARPLCGGANDIASPADGAISQCGTIMHGQLLQAKGHTYLAADLVGDKTLAQQFDGHDFITIYLSPKDYHRIHMPMSGRLLKSQYLPGKLFSVNRLTSERVPNLFTLNERLVCVFESTQGPFVLVMIGAMLVAGIETVWQGKYPVSRPSEYDHAHDQLVFKLGEEIGRFKFGSTVILFLPDRNRLKQELAPDFAIKFGEVIATYY